MKKLLSIKDSGEFWKVFSEEREKRRRQMRRLSFAKKIEIVSQMRRMSLLKKGK
jgi:hypothetical protein